MTCLAAARAELWQGATSASGAPQPKMVTNLVPVHTSTSESAIQKTVAAFGRGRLGGGGGGAGGGRVGGGVGRSSSDGDDCGGIRVAIGEGRGHAGAPHTAPVEAWAG